MDTHALAVVMSSVVSLVGLWYFWGVLFPRQSLERFRQDFFDLRDELFDFAADGNIAFDHAAYGLLRKTMNGVLRFGHRLTPLSFFVSFLLGFPEFVRRGSFERKWNESVADLPDEVVNSLRHYRTRMNILIVRRVLGATPLIVLIWSLAVLPGQLLRLLEWISRKFDRQVRWIDDAAYASGEAQP